MAGTAAKDEVAVLSGGLRDLGQAVPIELLRAREAAMGKFRPMLRKHGLTEQQWRVVRVLAACPGIDATALAGQAVLLAPSLTRILQFLEAGGLIQRRVDRDDQRRAVFALTARGAALFAAIAPESEQRYEEITAAFGADKLARLNALLSEFSAALAAADATVPTGTR